MVERILCRVPMWYRALIPGARWRIPSLTDKSIYLTFDDGPIPEVTPWVLDTLDRLGVKATFFCVADNVKKYPELFQEIKDRGHQVGNHTYHHISGIFTGRKKYMQDVTEAHKLIHSRYFRPPYGHIRLPIVRELSHSFEIIMWDVITRDYNSKLSPDTILGYVKKYARNGSIITFHDSIKAENNMKIAMPKAVKWLQDEGYTFLKIGDAP